MTANRIFQLVFYLVVLGLQPGSDERTLDEAKVGDLVERHVEGRQLASSGSRAGTFSP